MASYLESWHEGAGPKAILQHNPPIGPKGMSGRGETHFEMYGARNQDFQPLDI